MKSKWKIVITACMIACTTLLIIYIKNYIEKAIETRIMQLKDICKEGIEDMHIIAQKDVKNTCYIRITDNKILHDFNCLIKDGTYSPSIHSGQFSYSNIMTINTSKRMYAIAIFYGSYNQSIPKDSVNIEFNINNNFNVVPLFNDYYKATGFLGEVAKKQGEFNPIYQLRNHKLYSFIKKYVYDTMHKDQQIKGVKLVTCREIHI